MSAIASADDTSMNPVPAATLFEAALGRLSDVLTPGSFLEATPESLVVAETGGEIIYANAACERLTGFDRGELLGQQVARLLATDLSSHLAGSSFETTCTRRDGAQAVVWQTAINPVIALELLASGVWAGAGVLGPEAFEPRPFLDLLTEYGSPWGMEERTPSP